VLLPYAMPLPLTVVAEENMGALFTVDYGGHYLTVPELFLRRRSEFLSLIMITDITSPKAINSHCSSSSDTTRDKSSI